MQLIYFWKDGSRLISKLYYAKKPSRNLLQNILTTIKITTCLRVTLNNKSQCRNLSHNQVSQFVRCEASVELELQSGGSNKQ